MILTTCMRCGTHWLLNCLKTMGHGRVNYKGIRDYDDVAGYMVQSAARVPGQLAIHWGHPPFHLLVDLAAEHRIIAMTRDRRDVTIAGAYHLAARTAKNPGRDVAYYLHEHHGTGLWREGGQERSNNWWDAYAQWHDRVPHLLIRYEDMIADTAGQLRRAWDWFELGPDYPADAEMAHIIAVHNQPDQPHRRRGVVGEWREWFTPEEGAAFYDQHMAYLPELGYER